MADINVSVVQAASVAEDVEFDVTRTMSVVSSSSVAESITTRADFDVNKAEVISLSEYVDGTTGGEGQYEVEDGWYTEDEISAVGLFTKGILPRPVSRQEGYANVSVSGTFVGTIVLQRSYDRGVTWHTVASYTTPTETSFTDKEIGVRYRLGCLASWTSGTAVCRIGTAR